jgi:hypothetical protein
MPRFACSLLVGRPKEGKEGVVECCHTAFLVEAASEDEAVGKAVRIGHLIYPRTAGWDAPDVVACPDILVIDPDGTPRRAPDTPTEDRS